MSVCPSSCIQPTLCPARVVLCLAATQICSECLMYIPKTERLSPLDTWPEPSSKSNFLSEASTYLSHNDRLTSGMLCLVSFSPFHLFFYTFVHLTYSLLSLLLHPLWFCPSGVFTYTLHAQTVAQFTTTCISLWSLIRMGCVLGWVGV